jgi:hypothetical protein
MEDMPWQIWEEFEYYWDNLRVTRWVDIENT